MPRPLLKPESPVAFMKRWWRKQTPYRQDRYAVLWPLITVALFLGAMIAAFAYLRTEEMGREQEAIKRDVEYAHQKLRLKLLEHQEELMRLARDVVSGDMGLVQFRTRAATQTKAHSDLKALYWVDQGSRVLSMYDKDGSEGQFAKRSGEPLRKGVTEAGFMLAKDLMQPIYKVTQAASGETFLHDGQAVLQLHWPMVTEHGQFAGVLLAEYWIDQLLQFGVPPEIYNRYAIALLDAQGNVLAGKTRLTSTAWPQMLPEEWGRHSRYEIPVSPIGGHLVLSAQAWRTSQDLIGNSLFWLVVALSSLTAWMLLASWRHMRRRSQAQQALMSETHFRRAMENSMVTGMRAMDMQGRIIYVNPAFCQMTGWNEAELLGMQAPFPYWPDDERETLLKRMQDEMSGETTAGGIQVRVKRRSGEMFDARLYVSPLLDGKGVQTGWMTSMTDITEPTRIREQLQASHERFVIVMDALDAAVSVAPLGQTQLLYSNRAYRQWFGNETNGHLQLLAQASKTKLTSTTDSDDDVDTLAGLPTESLTSALAERTEVFVPAGQRWLEVRSRYLTWVDGRIVQMMIATDITTQRQAEIQAAQQAERAQTAGRLITMGEMASSVAHELNQPLTAISNYSNGIISRIKNKQIDEADLLKALEKTAHQAHRAGQIIQRIRSFVKRSEPNRTPSDVPSMVSEALELAEIELRRYNVHLSHYVAARLPKLLVDPILIEQVLINLMKNAAEAIHDAQRPPGKRLVELRVAPKTVDGEDVVMFSVSDTGKGLAPQMIDKVYEAFFSTKSEGMGMGLNLCRSIIESHQGRIEAENLYNGGEVAGCIFRFWIPVSTSPNNTA